MPEELDADVRVVSTTSAEDSEEDEGSNSDSSSGSEDSTADVQLTDVQGEDGFRLTQDQLEERASSGNTDDLSSAVQSSQSAIEDSINNINEQTGLDREAPTRQERNQQTFLEDTLTTSESERKADVNLSGVQDRQGNQLTEQELRQRISSGNTQSLEPGPGARSSASAILGSRVNRARNLKDRRDNNQARQQENFISRNESENEIGEIRNTIEENPQLANLVGEYRSIKNAPSKQELREKDPAPFNPIARLSPGKEQRLENFRQRVNQQDESGLDLGKVLDPIADLVTDGSDNGSKPLGPFAEDRDFNFTEVRQFSNKLERNNISSGELTTILGEESGEAIGDEVTTLLQGKDNPTLGVVGKGAAGATSITGEGLNSFLTGEDFNTSRATRVNRQTVDASAQAAGRSIGSIFSIPSETLRRGGQAQQLASGELTSEEAAAASEQAITQGVEFAENNPSQVLSGAGTGFLVTAPIGSSGFSRARSEGFDSLSTKVTDLNQRVKTQARPGGFDKTTFRDFLSGDLGERTQTPSEVRSSFSEEELLRGRNVPDTKESRPTTERTRRDFLADFRSVSSGDPSNLAGELFEPSSSASERIKGILSNNRKGSAQILKPLQDSKTKADDFDTTGNSVSLSDRIDRISDRLGSRNDRDSAVDRRLGRNRDRDTGASRNLIDSDSSQSGLGNALSTSLGVGLDEDVGQVPGLDDASDERTRDIQDNPPREEQDPFEDDRTRNRTENVFNLDTDLVNRDRIARTRDRFDGFRSRRDRDLDLDIDFEDEEKSGDQGLDLFGREQDRNLRRSIGADLLGISGGSRDGASNPLSLRAIESDNRNNREQDLF